ncbi:hypothetical protein AYO21_01216 [Fonsecaea monophora]|uniref:Choline monooxygenase, chloroplastic n=1 Tax=Fonsecaea monophora TaxID=254056 RepID=A0A177FM06_9EURO|nr:hypothetical protein AYO21_01216 [Fonsecaea monophora]OAG44726.1 hypothetical protein AYO21_01216 [Fonsecaea monophora]
MAQSFLKNYLGLGRSSPVDDDKTPVRALPASWYTSQEMYELERRAIFSRKWLLITHKLRLANPGDWLRYDVAGFQFILCQDRDGNINGFHNVCRHRAFPIVTEEKGHNNIFACKYHGWSYGLNGKLAKAPEYQDLPGFDKSQNGLLPIHTHIDHNGFIWVNLDGGAKPEIAWNDDFEGVDKQARFEHYNFDEYQFDHSWEMEGEYNWKILADNYNECYHCKTTHPDIPTIADLSSYGVATKGGHIQHFGNPTPEQIARGLRVAATYFFPNASLNVSPHFFFIQRFVPSGPVKSTMRYEVYRNKNSSDEDFELVNQIYKRIMSEDKYLCVNTQKNLNAGVFVNGELHPRMEKGPLFFQKSEERLAHLEEKLDLLLSGGLPNHAARQEQTLEDTVDYSEKSYSVTPPAREPSYPTSHPSSTLEFDTDNANPRPRPSDIAVGLDLYFKYCHKQPIWCFGREDIGDHSSLPEELACSILALTSRFPPKCDQMQRYGKNARSLIMLRIANGTVDLTTIENGNMSLGQFHVGLAFQLCRSATLDLESIYTVEDATTERKKRLFWSLQLLEQSFGRQHGLLSVPTETWRPSYSSRGRGQGPDREVDQKAPPLPRDDLGCSTPTEPGIWNTSVQLGWVWSRVRKYVSNCAHNIWKEPWRHDSMYAMVLSDFMETENRIPICHRYDSVKFYERKVEELKVNRDYWAPWLREQFNYHAIPTVLNHPFLYIIGAQHNPNLAIPNTFWRRSSELALLHSTWIVRMIDMVLDKQMPLVDPFFGHVAAIAATVHLYYCCAADSRLKHKSNTDFAKCRRFLKSFVPFSPACKALDTNLDKMTRIAAGSETMDVEDWMPSKIYLSVPLMWDILQFNCMADSRETPTAGLLDASLSPAMPQKYPDESSTLEIIVATSPEISVNTADGGQDAPILSYRAPVSSAPESTQKNVCNEISVEQADSLTLNTTPWLWADPSQFVGMGDMGYHDSQSTMGDARAAAWWEVENIGNVMFNHF